MKEHIQDILVGGIPITKLELANKEIEKLNNDIKILLKENEIKEKVILKYEELIDKARNYINCYKEPIIVPCYEPYYKELDDILNLKDKVH